MTKFITAYGNTNYRSFGGNGVELVNLSDINIIIGQNNSGKSNILRSMNVWNIYRKGEKPLSIIDYFNNDPSNPIKFRLEVSDDTDYFEYLIRDNKQGLYIEYEITPQDGLRITDSFIRKAPDEKIRHFCNIKTSGSSSEKITNVTRLESLQEFTALFELPEIIFVSEERMSSAPKDVRQKLQPIWNHGAANASMRPIRKALKEFIEETVQSKIEIHFEPEGDSFSIETEDDDLIEFNSLGSGIKQIFNLALIIANTSNSIVLIDEPEMNMHPSLLRRLLKLIFANNTNQYFISTHSNVLLDASYDRSVYQIFGGKTSSVKPCLTANDTRQLLDDIGAKASDLLQSNGIIWVEGPSDRTYINKWLELHGSTFNEGLDFTYQYYGGKLLAHYAIDTDMDDFVDILNVNKNAYIVMDSDWKTSDKDWTEAKLAPRKRHIIEACKVSDIDYWVTEGTEIENYIPDEVWTEFTGTNMELNKYANVQDNTTKYRVKAKDSHTIAALMSSENFRRGTDLDQKISKLISNISSWNKT